MKAGIGVLLINHNEKLKVLKKIKLIEELGQRELMVFVLDNGCSKYERLKPRLKDFKVNVDYVAAGEQLTIAEACNLILKKAEPLGLEWVYVLRNEEINPEWVAVVEREQSIKSRLGLLMERGMEEGLWGFYWWRLICLKSLGVSGQIATRVGGIGDSFENKDWLINVQAFKQIGSFDLSYFMEGAALDWLVRSEQRGWSLKVRKAERVSRKRSERTHHLRWYFKGRNMFLLIHKNFEGWRARFASLILVVLGPMVVLELWLRVGKRESKNFQEGWRDGWRLVSGQE